MFALIKYFSGVSVAAGQGFRKGLSAPDSSLPPFRGRLSLLGKDIIALMSQTPAEDADNAPFSISLLDPFPCNSHSASITVSSSSLRHCEPCHRLSFPFLVQQGQCLSLRTVGRDVLGQCLQRAGAECVSGPFPAAGLCLGLGFGVAPSVGM